MQPEFHVVHTEMEVVILAVTQDENECNEMVECYHSFISLPITQS